MCFIVCKLCFKLICSMLIYYSKCWEKVSYWLSLSQISTLSPIIQGWRLLYKTGWSRFPAHNKPPSPETTLRLGSGPTGPVLWHLVHLPQLVGAGWTYNTSQASLSPGVFKWEFRRENQHLFGGGLCGYEVQVLPVSRSALLENQVNIWRAVRQSKALIEKIYQHSQVDVEWEVSFTEV